MNSSSQIFISYCWSDSDVVNEIDNAFIKFGINLIRDIRDIEDYGNIKDFMRRIKDADFVILVVSDSYMKSPNCLFEILELVKDQDYKSKIFPIIIVSNGFDFYSAKTFVQCLEYWDFEYNKLNIVGLKLKPEESIEISKHLLQIVNIKNTIGSFITTLQEMRTPSLDELKKTDFRAIRERVNPALKSDLEPRPKKIFNPYTFKEAVDKLTQEDKMSAYEKYYICSPVEFGDFLLSKLVPEESWFYYNRDQESCQRFVLLAEIIKEMVEKTSIAVKVRDSLAENIHQSFAYDCEFNDSQRNRLDSLIKALIIIGDEICLSALYRRSLSNDNGNSAADLCRMALTSIGYKSRNYQ